jgi:type I restriction enzyme S subunit
MLTKYKLGELVDVTRGMSLPGENYAESGELVRLTLGNFNYNGGGFKENTSKSDIYYVGEVKPEFILNKGDIITPLTEQTIGLLGSTAMIPKSGKYIQSQDVALITPDKSKIDHLFCYYLVSSDIVRKQLSAAAQQTKIRHTSPDKIKDCTVWIPDLKIQEKIGKTLYDIDQKIALNTRMNAELEAMAKQLYDYWFVQFDFPDENGKPYKSSGGKMVWNEKLKREIPEGWEVKKMEELLVFSNGINYDKNIEGDKQYRIINVRNITSSSIFINKETLDVINLPSKQADNYLVGEDDIIIARSGTPGSTRLIMSPVGIIYCGFIIKGTPKEKDNKYILMYYLKQLEGTQATKTGGSILQNVSQDTLKSLLIIVPPKDIVVSFNNHEKKLFNGINACVESTNYLTKLRDSLLPMLMNGQVEIEE